MSALDFTARALALRAIAHNPLTFAEAMQARLPAGLSRFDSSGHSVCGLGSATYLADDLATAQLQDAHPEAVIAGDADSYWRLVGDSNGYITPEQLGCPAYAVGTDQLPWLQKAIDYVEANPDLNGVLLTQAQYELWRTPLPSDFEPATDYATTRNSPDGHFLVVRKPIRIASTHPLGSSVHFRGPNGGSLLTDYDVIDGTIYGDDMLHRGHGFVLWSEAMVFDQQAALEDLPALHLENIKFSTGMVAEKDTTWPASLSNPNSWDISNKFVTARNDHQHGRVEAWNCDIDGFFGEVFYLGGVIDDDHLSSELALHHVRIANSNGSAMNPNACAVVDLEHVLIEDCSATWEGVAGWSHARVAHCLFRNCSSAAVGGGKDGAGTRRGDNSQPVLTLDNVTVQNCDKFHVGSFVKGNAHLIDTRIWCVGNTANDAFRNIDLDVTIECDTVSMSGLINLYAHASAPAQSVENVRIRALLTRSDYAVANNHYMNGIVAFGFGNSSFGPNCIVEVRGDHSGTMPNILGSAPTFTDYRPKVITEGLCGTGSSGFPIAAYPCDVSVNPDTEFGYCWLRTTFGAAGTTGLFPVNVPPVTNFLDGHEVVISHYDGSSPNARAIVDGRVVIGFNDWVRLRADKLRYRWDVVEGGNVILGPFAVGDETTAITSGSGKSTFVVPQAFTLRDVIGTLRTPQAGGAIFTVDLNEGGASVLSTKLTIDNGEVSSRSAAAPVVFSDTSLAANAVMTVDVDQVGDGSARGMTLWLVGKWS